MATKKTNSNSTSSTKTAPATKADAKTSKNTSASKAKGSKSSIKKRASKLKKTLVSVFSFIVVILGIAWFFGGKPIVEVGAEGFTIIQTEEPIIYHIPEYLAGEYPPETSYAEINGVGAEEAVAKPDSVVTEKETVESAKTTEVAETVEEKTPVEAKKDAKKSKSSSGTKGSNAKADLGHPENDPLHLGNPSDALDDVSQNKNYLMVKPQYTISYNTETLCPNWAAWHLDTSNMGDADRCDDFRPDTELPDGWYGVKKADYQYNKYGFDRGHVCPSADRTTTVNDNSMTFLMTNMVPQSPDNNRVIWMHFETYERELANAGNELYIIAGPYGSGGTTSKGTFNEIPIKLKSGETLYMNVPESTWKVVIALPKGDDDLNRIDENAIAIAINVPNRMGMQKTGDWEQFICTIDDIEAMTGYDFFELLPDNIENKLEAKKYEYSKK